MRCDQRAPTADFGSALHAIASGAGRATRCLAAMRWVSAGTKRSRGVAISQRACSRAPGGQKGSTESSAGGSLSRLTPKQSRSLEFFQSPENFG